MKLTPYWWEDTAEASPLNSTTVATDSEETEKPPPHCEVLVIGSGYTGLHAALQTTRAGLDTVVVEARGLGMGCSTRNGGQVSNNLKPEFATLAKKHGEEKALEVVQEGFRAQQFVNDFVEAEQIGCDWHRPGRYIGAHNKAAFKKMEREALEPVDLRVDSQLELVSRTEQSKHINTEFYHGGLFEPQVCSVHPSKYHQGLLGKVSAAGTRLYADCSVIEIRRNGSGGDLGQLGKFTVVTTKGEIKADKVILATNGYTGLVEGLSTWHRRRVISIGSYVISTEPLPVAELNKLLPTQELICDSRKLIFYYRKCPEAKRIIFGGRVSLFETDPAKCTPLLQRELGKIFPSMEHHPVSHSWEGFIAYSFDHMPHIGEEDGLHYAMGYCGSGIGLSSYFGMKAGQQAAGLAEGKTPLDNLVFPTKPFYSGNPWFLAPSLKYYQIRDRLPLA